jgi:hypothetical protein
MAATHKRSILDELAGSIENLDTISLPEMLNRVGRPPSLSAEELRQRIAEDFMNMHLDLNWGTEAIVAELRARYGVKRAYVFRCLHARDLRTLK